jgi:thiol-disulfide isomerase/thioredoxin
MVRSAPPRLTMKNVLPDRVVAVEMNRGFAGGLPQLALLLGDDPLSGLLRDFDEPQLSEPGEIQGRGCYRVKLSGRDGAATFWIDQESFALRRIVMPTEGLREAISQERPIDHLSVVADFTNARLNGKVDPKAFEFEVPTGSEIVQFLVPPDIAQLLGKPVPNFKFVDLSGKPVTPASLAGKVAVLDFWATWCGPCRVQHPLYDQVKEKYRGRDDVVFLAIDTDEDHALVPAFLSANKWASTSYYEDGLSILLKVTSIPTTLVFDGQGELVSRMTGFDPERFVRMLSDRIDEAAKSGKPSAAARP